MASTTPKKTKLPIGKIETVSKPSILEKDKDIKSNSNSEEKKLLDSLQIFLRFYGIERSHASIRDIADITDGPFDYRDAVTALENMEFSANVGNLKASQITQGHCPLIIEFKDKTKAVLKSVDRKKKYEVYKNNLIKRKLLLESYERCEEYINNSSVELFLNCSDKDMKIKD